MLLSIYLIFCLFQPGVAYESVAYKKKRVIFQMILRNGFYTVSNGFWKTSESRALNKKKGAAKTVFCFEKIYLFQYLPTKTTPQLLTRHHLRVLLIPSQFCLCVKRPYSDLFWSEFSRIRTEYGEISVSLRIQSECGKIRTRITPNTDILHAVCLSDEGRGSRLKHVLKISHF